jgi:hypothetical protein
VRQSKPTRPTAKPTSRPTRRPTVSSHGGSIFFFSCLIGELNYKFVHQLKPTHRPTREDETMEPSSKPTSKPTRRPTVSSHGLIVFLFSFDLVNLLTNFVHQSKPTHRPTNPDDTMEPTAKPTSRPTRRPTVSTHGYIFFCECVLIW